MVDVLTERPEAIRGGARLEAIRSGDRWLEADLLVFVDELLPQPFLLRGLGLIDGRPGTPAPVDAQGRTSLPGLWAAGCCVMADLDHRACAEAGRRAATDIAARIGGVLEKPRVDA